MSRFSDFIDAVAAVYPSTGTPRWVIGQEHEQDHAAWTSFVCSFTSSRYGVHTEGARTRGDTVVGHRRVATRIVLWASSITAAENRVHALLVALDSAAGATDTTITAPVEEWTPIAGDIVSGGVRVVVTFDLLLLVLASDTAVLEDEAEPGAGSTLVAATSINLIPTLEATELDPVVLTPPEP